MRKRNRKTKKNRADGSPLGRFFSVFYAVCIVLTAAFVLVCGVSFAKIGTDRVSAGTLPDLITWTDILRRIL